MNMLAIGGYNFGEPLPPGEHFSSGSIALLVSLGAIGIFLVILYSLTVYLNYRNYKTLKRIEERLKAK
jgi:hypothetical protein